MDRKQFLTIVGRSALFAAAAPALESLAEAAPAAPVLDTTQRALLIAFADEIIPATDGMPYAGECDSIVPHYRKLVGIAIRPGYTQKLKELFGGVRGCTHITELAGALATAAFQTLAGQRVQDASRKPFQLDKCHALDSSAPAVARYYPKWYTGAEKIEAAGEGDQH